jgi:hypothetical protein
MVGWVVNSNRWAVPFIVLGIAGMAIGTKAEVPRWLVKVVLLWGGKDLKKAAKSLVERLG